MSSNFGPDRSQVNTKDVFKLRSTNLNLTSMKERVHSTANSRENLSDLLNISSLKCWFS